MSPWCTFQELVTNDRCFDPSHAKKKSRVWGAPQLLPCTGEESNEAS